MPALTYCRRHPVNVAIGLLGLCLAIGGLTAIGFGAAELVQAHQLHPEKDFHHMGKACTIVSVRHSEEAIGAVCWDHYAYAFTAEGEQTYHSVQESHVRSGTRCQGNREESSFVERQSVDCWRPLLSSLPSQYRCGNPQCYKIFDPALDAKLIGASASSHFALGAAVLIASMILPCALVWLGISCNSASAANS
uniref:DUF3592 domain-containing protein n=1 Tax=Pyrodinium bahamense TaxID=73915 RepID=A0A7S0AL82_9DINO|mmetsp:Transcript_36906/g.102463  ORF Transcript_36906/g.102463 Transcript_36906/m.102463 type:complete len:193 (+) Transcript_36906:66-644(+)|eukprot:CAMPEP_0179073516 /NCGR_PEP_ID=MMETSP0796-20121207/32609_1 /TAXON_ID=73915 /ORGANISM="Pyrodinium bahamense, Strain pbaha01" /LENGTH=192 /DNA_ID=CAMNT_0020770707 /DNA_START=65 /DNA_END=643 /DNA_ORIENTATION=+